MWQHLQEMILKNYKMKQFESRSLPTEEVKYSVEFPTEEKYMLRRGRLCSLMCIVRKIKVSE